MDWLWYLVGFVLCAIIFFLLGMAEIISSNQVRAEKGLFFCKLGSNYVWLDKGDVLKFFFSDNSE